MPRTAPALAVAALAGLSCLAAPAHADVIPNGEVLRSGQSFAGDVPARETLRFKIEMAQGSRLRLRFTLKLSSTVQYLPANFQRVSVLGPDGAPVPFDAARDSFALYLPKSRTSTFRTLDWPAPTAGTYTFSITHNSQAASQCIGRVKVLRARRIPIEGALEAPEAERTFPVQLQPGDVLSARVRRSAGGPPEFASYSPPVGADFRPSQRLTRRGAQAQPTPVFDFGEGAYVVGPREGEDPAGAFKGTITIRPGGPYGRVPMVLVNPPGIPLSVRDPDAFLDVTWATSGAGVDFNGQYTFVTGEASGRVLGKYYNEDLTDIPPYPAPTILASSADFTGAVPVQGHRLAFLDGVHYVAFASSDGASANISRFPFNLTRNGFSPVVAGSPTPTNEMFLALDETAISVGIPFPPNGHTVHRFDATTVASLGPPVTIGSAGQPHAQGASAVYRSDQSLFELWAPTFDSPSPAIGSDLNHGLFTTTWTTLSWDPGKVAGNDTETRPTSVVFDALTGVTIMHYVQPTVDASGFGILHRRLFDALGVEVPDSHETLGVVRRNRPAAFLNDRYLWVAAEGLTNPVVVRYALLRR